MLRSGRRSGCASHVQRHVALVGNAVTNGTLELRAQGKHGAEYFSKRREIVVGNPLAEPHELHVEHRPRIEDADDVLGLDTGLAVVQIDDDAAHALLTEGHEHTSAYGWLHPIGHVIGEGHVERHGQGYVAELECS